jgi:hypothetical protein
MSVVVNEFEVVPTPADRERGAEAAAPEQPERKKPLRDEVEHTLRMRAERRKRLEAT